jgi:hypothetical protein
LAGTVFARLRAAVCVMPWTGLRAPAGAGAQWPLWQSHKWTLSLPALRTAFTALGCVGSRTLTPSHRSQPRSLAASTPSPPHTFTTSHLSPSHPHTLTPSHTHTHPPTLHNLVASPVPETHVCATLVRGRSRTVTCPPSSSRPSLRAALQCTSRCRVVAVLAPTLREWV